MKLLCGQLRPGYGWFRVLGYGMHWKDSRKHALLFSERMGYRGVRVGAWTLRAFGPTEW